MMTLMTAQQIGPLSALVREAKGRLHLSYEELADRTIDPTTGKRRISHTWIHKVAEGTAQVPTLDRVVALADAIGEPVERVKLAVAAQFYGLARGQLTELASDDLVALIGHVGRLPPSAQRQILRIVETWSNSEEGTE